MSDISIENRDFHTSETSETRRRVGSQQLDVRQQTGFRNASVAIAWLVGERSDRKVYAFTGHARNVPKTAPKRREPAGDLLRERRK